MDAELPFGYRDGNPLTQQQQLQPPPETSFAQPDQPRDSLMSEPEMGENFDLDAFLHDAEVPRSHPPGLPMRMNANATPWTLTAPVNYGYPPSGESTRQFPYSEPVYGYTSRFGAPRLIPPSMGMASLQRSSSQATAATQQAEQEALYGTNLARQETFAKLCSPPAKSTISATRKPVEGECPVCWEAFIDTQTVLFCKTTCGNNFHKSCIVEWLIAPANRQESLKCPMCRGAWDDQELKELHLENGISPPRPNKRYRPDPGWVARHQQREHLRRLARQRAFERRNSTDRSRAAISTYDSRPNFIAEQSPQTSPTSPTGPENRFAPQMMSYPTPTSTAFSPAPNAPGMAHSSQSMASNGTFIQPSYIPPAAAFGVPQFIPNNGNITLQPAQMMPYQFQPFHEAVYATQSNPAYPVYPAMIPHNYQPATAANMMPQFGQMSQPDRRQGMPATPIMQHGNMPHQQHPCPAMRQQNMSMQQQPQSHFGNNMLQPLLPSSQASMQLRQYHYSQSYTVYMNH